MKLHKVGPLHRGDKVGIVAPGAIFNREKFRLGLAFMKKAGLVPVLGPHLYKKDFIFSGTLDERLESFMEMARRKDIKALWCVRAGYGVYALADRLMKEKAPVPAKVVLGMSDATALHLVMLQKWRWPVLHSPLLDRIGISASPEAEKKCLLSTLFDPDYRFQAHRGLRTIGGRGTVQGDVIGGNLALVATSIGTKWEIDTRGKILFLEDIGERAYRFDRMLFQLRAAGKLNHVKGIILGDFTGCTESDGRDHSFTVLKRHFSAAKFPVVSGLRTGHGDLRLTIPFGVKARLTASAHPHFEILETYDGI